jgi:hypothetical protein
MCFQEEPGRKQTKFSSAKNSTRYIFGIVSQFFQIILLRNHWEFIWSSQQKKKRQGSQCTQECLDFALQKGAIFHFHLFTPTVAIVKLIAFEGENNG